MDHALVERSKEHLAFSLTVPVVHFTCKGMRNMKRVTKGFFAVGLATWVAFFGGTGLAQSIPAPKPFQVFDGLSYANKPDLSVYGFRPITVVYGQQFGPDWFKQIDRLPDFTQVQTVAREASQKGYDVVLDIEHWPVKGSPEVVGGSLT